MEYSLVRDILTSAGWFCVGVLVGFALMFTLVYLGHVKFETYNSMEYIWKTFKEEGGDMASRNLESKQKQLT